MKLAANVCVGNPRRLVEHNKCLVYVKLARAQGGSGEWGMRPLHTDEQID